MQFHRQRLGLRVGLGLVERWRPTEAARLAGYSVGSIGHANHPSSGALDERAELLVATALATIAVHSQRDRLGRVRCQPAVRR